MQADKSTESENFVSLNSLVSAIYDSCGKDDSRGGERFCYILGSGASATSGIKTGVELARIWIDDLKKRGEVCDLDPENSEDYFKIFKKRFEVNPKLGQHFIRTAMKNAEPSFGYYPFSQQLSGKWNNVVITTNFDKLIEEALHIYTSEKPLVIDNEKLTDLYDPNMEDPVIIQIHRGMFNSINSPIDVQELALEWKVLLDQILNRYIPIVIGYGGGDKTLMGYLENAELPNNIYWCYRQCDKAESLKTAKKITASREKVKLIEIENVDAFDFIMLKINEAFKYPQPEQKITDRADKWKKIVNEKINKLNKDELLLTPETDRRIKYFDEKIKENPIDAALFYSRASAYHEKGEYDKALADLDEAIRLKPEDADAYNNRGIAYAKKGEYDKALADYSEAIRLKPEDAVAHYNRGNTYAEKGEYDKALADYSEAIRLKPEDAVAYHNRGNAYAEKGEYDKALADLDEAIRLKPENAVAYHNRGNAYAEKGEYDKALADYSEAIRLKPEDADAYHNRGNAYAEKGEYDKALADLDEAIRLKPEDAVAHYNRGNTYAEKGEYDKALADYSEAIRLKPEDADAYNNRGIAYAKKGEYDKALADYSEAIRLKPEDAVAYHNRGIAYAEKGEYDKALADYSEAIRLKPEDADAYYRRGLVYKSLGKSTLAEDDFIKAKELGYQEEQA